MSEESRRKISKAQKGRVQSKEEKEKRRQSMLGKKWKMSDEGRKNISEAQKGRVQSKETKRKRSESLKGRSYEELYGKKKADEIKKLKSEQKKGKNNPIYGNKRVYINHPEIKINKSILVIDLDHYLNEGWLKGRNNEYRFQY